MNFFPDQLNTPLLGFSDPGNVYEEERSDDGAECVIRCILGPALGYEATLYYNGRLLIGFQEHWGEQNEKLDFNWENGKAQATTAAGQVHELSHDDRYNPVIWKISGPNTHGETVVLRYLRNFYDDLDVLYKSVRYEENPEQCHRIYQYFIYGLETPWQARKAYILDYPYAVGNEEYWATEVPVDILEFPETFQEAAVELLEVR